MRVDLGLELRFLHHKWLLLRLSVHLGRGNVGELGQQARLFVRCGVQKPLDCLNSD